MHFLLVTDSYPPEIRSASHLMLDLAGGLRERGHRVSVATTWPRYNLDRESAAVGLGEFSVEDGVEVLRIHSPAHHNIGYIRRGIGQLALPMLFARKLRRYGLSAPDAVVVYSPPLPLALVGRKLRRRNVGFFLNVQDLFPQNAIDLGILDNPLIIRFFRWIERRAYRAADVVSLHSEGNRTVVAREHPDLAHKFVTLHNWVELAPDRERETDRDFRALFGIERHRFVALFAGVMGPSQDLDLVVDAASKLRDCADLLFLVVGDGSEKERLQMRVRDAGLQNVIFQPFVSREEYAALLRQCDLGLVCLSAKNRTPVVPGKLLGYMAAALPVVALLNRESDGHVIISESGCGFSAPSDDPRAIVEVLRRAYDQKDTLAELGQAGRRYAAGHFSKDACVSRIESLLVQVTSK